MKNHVDRRLPTLWLVLYCAFLGAGFAAMLCVAWLLTRPQLFETRAKLVAGSHFAGPLVRHPEFHDMVSDLFGTLTVTLESPEIHQKAVDRLKALHPELVVCEVTLDVSRTKGSGILNLTVKGSNPTYSRRYLDAVLDEIIAYRYRLREESANKVLQPLLQAVADRQRKMEDALQELEDLRKQAESISAKLEQDRLPARLKRLREERDDLRLDRSTERLAALDAEIQRVESELAKHEETASLLRKATERYGWEKKAYEQFFEQAEVFENSREMVMDYVAIQERATQAVEVRWLTWSRIGILYPSAGGLAGAIFGAWMATRRPAKLVSASPESCG